MNNNSYEIEAALVIYHIDSEKIIAKIAALSSIGRFRLLHEKAQLIHDIYFDTPGEGCKNQGIALRLRNIDGKQLITLKGDSKPTIWGGHSRLEIELSWSDKALQTILAEIKNRKINLANYDREGDFSNAVEVLRSSGLDIIQERTNQRKIRNIVRQDGDNRVLAEMAIDAVAYQFHNRTIRFHEVEIESKSTDGVDVVQEVIELLTDRYSSILKKWEHSKLVTGKAIEQLMPTGKMDLFIDDAENLKPGGYDLINSYLSSIHNLTLKKELP